MVELSPKRIEQILHEETLKKESLETILRGVYSRYMRLYEKYFDDIDALNDDVIEELKNYHKETRSLVRCYYMDIPYDICKALNEFDDKYSSNLLGSDWHKVLFDSYDEFKSQKNGKDKTEECLKAEFEEQIMAAFYNAMDYVFRDGFGTGSKTAESVVGGLSKLIFGKKND